MRVNIKQCSQERINYKKVYRLYGKEDAAGFFDHASGHQPTEESVATAYRWLAEQFGLKEQKQEWHL